MTRILGKDDLLSAGNLKRELVEVPELNGSLWMRELSAEHVIHFKTHIDQLRENGITKTNLQQDIEIMAMVISYSACDEQGNLLFESSDEAKKILQNNLNVIMTLGNKALAMSGVMIGGNGMTSEVAANLPNSPTKSLPDISRGNSRKRGKKS